MAPSQGSGTAAYRAAGEARRLEHSWLGPEHFLLAMTYAEHMIAPLLHRVGSSQQALLEALASRGVEVPAVDPPVYRPWRGRRRTEVTEAELEPVIEVLTERHPPGSEWRWA